MRIHGLRTPVAGVHPLPGESAERPSQRLGEGDLVTRSPFPEPRHGATGEIGGGHERGADPLGQAADQGSREVLAQPRNLPGEGFGFQDPELLQPYLDRHAVVARPGFVDVADGQLQSRNLPPVGEVGDAERPGVGHAIRRRQPQCGVIAQGFQVLVECCPRDHAGGQSGGIEVVESLVRDQQLRSAHPVSEPFGLVVSESVCHYHRVTGLPFPFHQTGADEDLPSLLGMADGVVRATPGNDRHPEQADGFVGDNGGAAG